MESTEPENVKEDNDGSPPTESPDTPELASGATSSSSSPIPLEHFEPKYSVRVSNDVTKDGDVIKYIFKVKEVIGEKAGTTFVISRQYEDFEYLHHCLITNNKIDGLIVPPLPCRPTIDPYTVEARSRKQLGCSSRKILGDDFQKDSKHLEKYLQLLLVHSVFGNDVNLERFLTIQEAPPRTKIRRGLLDRISESLDSRRVTPHDCEEFFQQERNWVQQYQHAVHECSQNFKSTTYAMQRLCGQLAHLATAFNLSVGNNEGNTGLYNKLNTRFSEALEDAKYCFEVEAHSGESTLGFCLDLYAHYIDSEYNMLLRRMCLMIDYENANKMLDKARPNRRDVAEKAKLDAERLFEECSDVARQEIKKLHRRRIREVREALALFAESQLRAARDAYALLARARTRVVHFPDPVLAPAVDY